MSGRWRNSLAAGEDGTPLDEDDAAVGERVDRRVVLVDDDDGNASLANVADHPPDVAADEWRQPLGRLVEDDQLRVGHQGPADRQHLLLAARRAGRRHGRAAETWR